MNSNKDDRWSKQLGDFGESLVMYLLGNLKEQRVALVDHVGEDIISTDRLENGHRYAISVKSRWFKTDDPSLVFEKGDQDKLSEFAKEFNMIPVVALVMIDKSADVIDVYIMKLNNFKTFASDPDFQGITFRSGDTLAISNAQKNQKNLQSNPRIDHSRFTRSQFGHKLDI